MKHKRFNKRRTDAVIMVGVAAIIEALMLIYRARFGFQSWLPLMWLVGLGLAAWAFADLEPAGQRPRLRQPETLLDLTIILILGAPVYLWRLHTIPVQINTDEIAIMRTSAQLAAGWGSDLFGLSNYFHFPALVFALFGHLSRLAGGIDLSHFRLIHALSGLAIAVATYLWFSVMLPRRWALAGAILVEFSHALIGISRMAMRDNTALLFEVITLGLLFAGWRWRRLVFSYWGGVFLGLTFYTYYPSRMTGIIWGVFVIGTLMAKRWRKPMARQLVAVTVGLGLAVVPLALSTVQAGPDPYSQDQFLFLPAGRALERGWVNASSDKAAVGINLRQGLTVFNNRVHDNGYIYPNYNHGFVDPLTGIMIWLGLAVIFFDLVRRRQLAADRLMVGGFLIIWLTLAALITKAPNYTRLLIVLPFVAYLVVRSLHGLTRIFNRRMQAGLIGLVVAVIAVWNLSIFHDFVRVGQAHGDAVGGMARYVEQRRGIPHFTYVVAADQSRPFFDWGNEAMWQGWTEFFTAADREQTVKVVNPDNLGELTAGAPLAILMSSSVWNSWQPKLEQTYPDITVSYLKPDNSLVAAEILADRITDH